MQDAQFVSEGISLEKFPLVIGSQYHVPYLLHLPGTGYRVQGEVYRVDDALLAELDKFEGHPAYYTRKEMQVVMPDGLTMEVCHAYFKAHVDKALLELPFLSNYPLDDLYIPPHKRTQQYDFTKQT